MPLVIDIARVRHLANRVFAVSCNVYVVLEVFVHLLTPTSALHRVTLGSWFTRVKILREVSFPLDSLELDTTTPDGVGE